MTALGDAPREGSGWTAEVERARRLVLRYGWNATAYQIVNPGIRHWFAPGGDAVVGYVRHGTTRVVAGAPVCERDALPAVVAAFERDAATAGERVCYFGAEARLEELLRASERHAFLLLGAQPVWRPSAFVAALDGRASLRAQVNRARNKGIVVTEWPPARAAAAPALRGALREWLGTRGLPPLHFLVEPDTLSRLDDRRIFVASRAEQAVGFVVTSPVPARRGWLVEQFVRGAAAPNGTTELMLRAAAEAALVDGAEYLTLGLAPLSRHVDQGQTAPLWARLLLGWVRAHGRRFYNFDGLDAFKSKFVPERWDPVYAIAAGRAFPPSALWAIAGAFAGRSPVSLVAHALGRAAVLEAGDARRALARHWLARDRADGRR